jgi:RNA polymerase sigma factor (sigma-70 family)
MGSAGTRRADSVDAGTRGDHDDAEQGFRAACLEQWPQLRRIVAGMGFAASDGDDILQDVFLEISARPGTYRGPEEAARWLSRATVNRCLLEYRRRQRYRRGTQEILRRRPDERSGQANAGQAVLDGEEIEITRAALRELDGASAAVLVLRYFCELDATQIGEVLDLPPATVRSRLRTARLRLAERLTQRGIEP